MFVKGDKVKLTTSIFGYEAGQTCTVEDINENLNYVSYKFDDNHYGVMDINTFKKCFEKYEEPKHEVVLAVDSEYVDWLIENSAISVATAHGKCTVVTCQLPNGFVIVESSSCVDPKNYDKELGVEICMNRIIDKIYELEAYHLQQTIWIDENGCECCGECCCEDECDDDDECLDTDLDCDNCDDYDCPNNTRS